MQPPSSQVSSSIQHESRSGTGIGTPSDSLSQHTLHPPRESFSSSSTTTNKEHGASDSHSHSGEGLLLYKNSKNIKYVKKTFLGTTPTPSLMQTGSIIVAGSSGGGGASVIATGSLPHLTHSMSLQQQVSARAQTHRLRFVSSVEFRNSSGETSTTPLSPDSPAEDSSGEIHRPHRLQRSRAQSRKTFRLKRGRPNHGDLVSLIFFILLPFLEAKYN